VSAIVNNCAGTGTLASAGVYHVTGSLGKFVSLENGLTNGATYDYKAERTSSASGFETGKATWNSTAKTLTVTSITSSSNSGSAVAWGSANLTVYIGVDAATLNALSGGAGHDAVTVSDSSEIDFTLSGQQISGSLRAGSIDESKLDTSVNASLDLADSASQPGHSHVTSDVTGLDTALSGKASSSHTHTASNVTDFDTAVAANSAVTANTAKRSYPSGDETKLAGIESGATADQTDTEIETAYNNRVSTATQAESEAGTSTTVKRMTPQRVRQNVLGQIPLSQLSNIGNAGCAVFHIDGQSNAQGLVSTAGTAGYTAHPNVFEFVGSNSTGLTAGASNGTWVPFDPNKAALTVPSLPADIRLLSYFGDQACSWTYDAICQFSDATGLTCFIIGLNQYGVGIQYWNPATADQMYDFGNVHLTRALASIVAGTLGAPAAYPNVSHVHFWLMSHGEADAYNAENRADDYVGMPPGDRIAWQYYADGFKEVYDARVADGHLSKEHTRIIYNPPGVESVTFPELGTWRGHDYVAALLPDTFEALDTTGVEMEGDQIHFAKAGHETIAARALAAILSGVKPKRRQDSLRTIYEDEAPRLSNDLDADGKAIIDAVLDGASLDNALDAAGFGIDNVGHLDGVTAFRAPPRIVVDADITLADTDYYAALSGTLTADRVINLPQATSGVVGRVYKLKNITTAGIYKVTLSCFSGNFFLRGSAFPTTLVMAAGDEVFVTCYATNLWLFSTINHDRTYTLTRTGTATVGPSDFNNILTNGSAATFTLPSATIVPNKRYLFTRRGAGIPTIASVSSQTFDGLTGSVAIHALNGVLELESDGSNWIVIRGLLTTLTGYRARTAAFTFDQSDHDVLNRFTSGSGNPTYPACTSLPAGYMAKLRNDRGSSCTLTPTGSDTFLNDGVLGTTMSSGSYRWYMNDGVSVWILVNKG